jgi:hypothetical protein
MIRRIIFVMILIGAAAYYFGFDFRKLIDKTGLTQLIDTWRTNSTTTTDLGG